jgi:hypothetical protein
MNEMEGRKEDLLNYSQKVNPIRKKLVFPTIEKKDAI